LKRPDGITQNKFSSGFKGGFLRDFPLNKKRNVAIAVGPGLSYNKYFQNLIIAEENGIPTYNNATVDYSKNKLEQFFIDVPIELRWRTSGPESHKFWRIYTGLQLSYLAYSKSVYIDGLNNATVTNNPDLNKFQAGVYLVWGYNTWNFYGYYGLTPFFKSSAKIQEQSVGFNALHLGLMFYIL
jgi:hypothetical protein